MQTILRMGLVVGSLGLIATPAAAQRVPDKGMVAIGFTLGGSKETDDALSGGLELGAQVEGYPTPRVAARGKISSPV